MTWAVLGDIHGNLSALTAVLRHMELGPPVDGVFFLGDIIDYGMRPNECIDALQAVMLPFVARLAGNHESALLTGETGRFSSERGRVFSHLTAELLTDASKAYLKELNLKGAQTVEADGKRILAVHGSLRDPFWGTLSPEDTQGDYDAFDMVLSGHSHRPHFFSRYYACENIEMRNQKKTIFMNPGSVGQPRNHNPRAQYATFDSETEQAAFHAVAYDIEAEQALYDNRVGSFYKTRLSLGV